MEILPLGAALFHADGQTDMTKLVFVARNFANAPKAVIPPHAQHRHNKSDIFRTLYPHWVRFSTTCNYIFFVVPVVQLFVPESPVYCPLLFVCVCFAVSALADWLLSPQVNVKFLLT